MWIGGNGCCLGVWRGASFRNVPMLIWSLGLVLFHFLRFPCLFGYSCWVLGFVIEACFVSTVVLGAYGRKCAENLCVAVTIFCLRFCRIPVNHAKFYSIPLSSRARATFRWIATSHHTPTPTSTPSSRDQETSIITNKSTNMANLRSTDDFFGDQEDDTCNTMSDHEMRFMEHKFQ